MTHGGLAGSSRIGLTPRRSNRRTSCSAPSRGSSARPTFAARSDSRSGIIALFRLGSFIPAPFVDFGNVQQCLAGNAGQRVGSLRPRQPLQRRCAAAAVDLRARHHAVHHRVDHRAAAARRHPPLRDPLQGGPVGPGAAHAVHALPHHRARRAAVDDAHHRRPQRARCSRRPARRVLGQLITERRLVRDPAHGHHHDRRHRPHHVDGRAHHRARHRQRHVAADLHLDRRDLPELALGDRPARAARDILIDGASRSAC